MKVIHLAACLAAIPLLGACADLRQDKLTLSPEPDCTAEPARQGDWHYRVLGTPRPVINWSGCDKSGAELQGAYLDSAMLIDTDLSGANLENADLGAAFLVGSDLSNANLRNVNLTAVYAADLDLTGADLTGTVRKGGTYQNVELSGATWSDGETICAAGSMNRCD